MKLEKLRGEMARQGFDAYYIPSVDEHINEYLPTENQRRQFVTAFTGSAGDCVVSRNSAWVFVDSRYHEQAGYEVDKTCFQISRLGLEGQPTPVQAIQEMARRSSGKKFVLGFDPFTVSVAQWQQFERAFKNSTIVLKPAGKNLIDTVWGKQRPRPAHASIYAVPTKYTGLSAKQKLALIRKDMAKHQIDVLPITKLDQIAWLFNLRGSDIAYNPVFTAYAVITPRLAYLFTEKSRIPKAVMKTLSSVVSVLPYEEYKDAFSSLLDGKTRVLIDPKHTTAGTLKLVQKTHAIVVEADHPVELRKAVKNKTELHWMQQAHLKSGRAKIRALYWLEQQLKAKKPVTEKSFADALERFYAEEPEFIGLSFNTISGSGANSSIVHYGTPSATKKLSAGELFLIDSGVQYMGGTTDDTRTTIVGTPTAVQKHRFTLVLQAHINCAAQVFPKGTDGIRLDAITRAPLWKEGLDYGHGTGHGVGAFLNVHEGPNGIHRLAKTPFEPGMITSIEPGYYQPGWGGIRLENLYVCVEKKAQKDTHWLGFETLTYIPFDTRLIDFSMLSTDQKDWLKDYHAEVLRKIGKTLPKTEQTWLKQYCSL